MAKTRGGRAGTTGGRRGGRSGGRIGGGDQSASSAHGDQFIEFEGAFFTTDEALDFYQKSSDKPICGGKWCNTSNFVNGLQTIIENFDALGWSKLLVVSDNYYEKLVREFFANMREEEGVLLTVVKGKRISFDAAWINNLLGCRNEGSEEFVHSKWSPIIVKSDLKEFFPNVVNIRGVNNLKMTYFTPCHRVLYFIVTGILAPTLGHKTDISHLSLHLFYAIMRKIPINYGAFFIKYLTYNKKKSQHGLCFGRIITLILHANGFKFDAEQPSTPTSSDIIDDECFRHMHMIHSGKKWIYRASKYGYCGVDILAHIGDYIYDDTGRGLMSRGRRGGKNEAGPSSVEGSSRVDEGLMSMISSGFEKLDKKMSKMNNKFNLYTEGIEHIMTKKQKASFTAFIDARKDAEDSGSEEDEQDEEEGEDAQEEDEEDEDEEEEAEEDEDDEDEEDDAPEVRAKKKNDK